MNIEVRENFDAKNLTSFKVSGLIERAYFPKNVNELIEVLKTVKKPIVLGNCSNVLLSSCGISGDVIFTQKCNAINIDDKKVYAECGLKGPMASNEVLKHSLSGFEFMIGFPGSIGGEVYMNASAKEQAISDHLSSVQVFDLDKKEVLTLTKEKLEFGYRNSICQRKNYIVLSAEFELEKKSQDEIKERMDFNLTFRKNHQPSLTLPNCGSVFKNPENNSAGRLLDSIGAKELTVGGAKVWENHANFIINYNSATSEDILNLMLLMYNKVNEKYDIKLNPEVVYLGNNSEIEEKIWKTLKQK